MRSFLRASIFFMADFFICLVESLTPDCCCICRTAMLAVKHSLLVRPASEQAL